MSVGALLVEAKIMSEEHAPPPTKRMKRNPYNGDEWIHLAEIYHSMEEKDVVQGLFEDKIAEACGAVVREALQDEDQARWKQARSKYMECLRTQTGTAAENFLYEASFKCSALLSDWKSLNKDLKKAQLDDNLDQVWSDNWSRDHLLPWLFLLEIHHSLQTTVLSIDQEFNSTLNAWLRDPDRKNHIETKLSEMLSVLLVVTGETAKARYASDASINQFLSVWQQLDSLNNQLRGSWLLSVHKLMDTHNFLALPSPSDFGLWTKRVDMLLTQWKDYSPSNSDNLVSWETQAVYRSIFVRKLEDEARKSGSGRESFSPFNLNNYWKTLEFALKQNNFFIAREYYNKIKYEKKGQLDGHLHLSGSKVRLLRAKLERDSTPEKVTRVLEALEPLDSLMAEKSKCSLEYCLSRELHLHAAEVYRTLLAVVQDNPSVLDSISHPGKTTHLNPGDGDILAYLKQKVVLSLEQAVAAAKAKSECGDLAIVYLQLTTFCHETDDPQFQENLIQSLLRAMKYGSSEARILFPCLLDTSLTVHADLFISESKQVPEWMFLPWVAQLLAHLDTEVGRVVAPLLLDLASAYPAALQIPFQVSKEMYRYNYLETRAIVAELSEKLRMDNATGELLRALSCVCHPQLCLIYHIDRLKTAVTQNLGMDALADAYESTKSEAFPPDSHDKIKGPAFNSNKVFTDEIQSVYNLFTTNEISENDFVKRLDALSVKVKKDMMDFKKTDLSGLSPWLLEGYQGGVEIPGQYTGESRPLPNHHVTITAFQPHVITLDSLRRPIKITIQGSDARDYPFLVKFGEDLRQDQRIQQIFGLMNQLLSADVTASRRQIAVQTYSVVPLNSRLGIIQWVENTTTLENFMISNKDLKAKAVAAQNIFLDGHCDPRNPAGIKKFYETVKKEQSVKVYLAAVKELPANLLRSAVQKLSTSTEAFFHLRSVMVTNHACLSVCHWLLGIGDRHLQNTLVCLDSGRLLGIDFGYAFGTATQLLGFPELIPFRLTPQILNLAAPFGTTGLMKETMVHTLRVLRENSRLLLATMAVFILEPSVDWVKAARRHEAYSTEGANWLPQLKIRLARQKLEGADSRRVMETDLETGHGTRPYYKKLRELLLDECDVAPLRGLPHTGLSPRQQVECLIAHATNQHILSKTFIGWASWV